MLDNSTNVLATEVYLPTVNSPYWASLLVPQAVGLVGAYLDECAAGYFCSVSSKFLN